MTSKVILKECATIEAAEQEKTNLRRDCKAEKATRKRYYAGLGHVGHVVLSHLHMVLEGLI